MSAAGTRRNFLRASLLSLAAYPLAFANQMILSYYFGTSAEMDAYWLAMTLVTLLGFFVQPAREALVPEFFRRRNEAPQEGERYLSRTGNFLLLCLSAFALTALAAPGMLTRLVAAGDDPATRARVAKMLLILSPLVVLSGVTEMLNGVFIALNRITYQYLGRLLTPACSIVFLLLWARSLGPVTIGVAAAASLALLAVLQVAALRGAGVGYQWSTRPGIDPAFVRMSGAMLIGYLASQLYVLVERKVFTGLGPGVLSAFQYGRALAGIPEQVIVSSLTMALWPSILQKLRDDQFSRVHGLSLRAGRLLFLALAFVALCGIKFSRTIVYLIYYHGAFGEGSLKWTSLSVNALLLALCPLGLNFIMGRTLVSLQKARALLMISLSGTAAGTLTLLAAGWSQRFEIAVLHPFFSAAAGFAVTACYFFSSVKWTVSPPECRRWLLFASKFGILWLGLLYFYPSLPDIGSPKLPLLFELAFRSVVLLAVFSAAAQALGLVDIKDAVRAFSGASK
ncbi:MAG: hypothetical protein HY551_01205 [Elusimicrobia bacterium]|nr:hypothetical protein [Elusimicrobiota bacterium]